MNAKQETAAAVGDLVRYDGWDATVTAIPHPGYLTIAEIGGPRRAVISAAMVGCLDSVKHEIPRPEPSDDPDGPESVQAI